MRGAANIAGIKMNKSLKAKKRLKVWLEAKKQRGIEYQKKIKEAKKNGLNWRHIKF